MKNDKRIENICRELSEEKSLEFEELQKRTGIPDYTLRYLLGELAREGRVERCGYKSKKKLYRLTKPVKEETHCVREPEQKGGIKLTELEAVKRQAKPGTPVRIWNPYSPEEEETGRIVRTRIKAVYPHLVVFENGQSATWAQMAAYWRNRRGFIS